MVALSVIDAGIVIDDRSSGSRIHIKIPSKIKPKTYVETTIHQSHGVNKDRVWGTVIKTIQEALHKAGYLVAGVGVN